MEEEKRVEEESRAGIQSPEATETNAPPIANGAVGPAQEDVSPPPSSPSGCCGAGSGGESAGPRFIYAIGTIQARFPSLGVEKEFVQSVKEGRTAGLADAKVLHEILSREENGYLAREVCFVFSVEHIDAYILHPRTETELRQLVEAIKPAQGIDCDVIIGVRGPLAPPDMCNGLQVPIVQCDRIYSFDIEEFIKAVPRPKGVKEGPFQEAARDLFARIMQLADNVGEMDEHRAVNYVALRYPAVYALAMDMYAADKSLVGVEVRPSRLGGTRRVVQIIFSHVDRKTDVIEKHFARVDVTEKWPFLVTKLQPFYDR